MLTFCEFVVLLTEFLPQAYITYRLNIVLLGSSLVNLVKKDFMHVSSNKKA